MTGVAGMGPENAPTGAGVVSGTVTATVDTTGLATSAKQDTTHTDLGTIDGHVDGLETLETAGNASLATIATNITSLAAAPTSTDAGHNTALTTTNATNVTAQATTKGFAWFSAPLANNAPIYLARGAGITIGTGIELLPGAPPVPLGCANTNEWYAITGTVTQNLHVVAE